MGQIEIGDHFIYLKSSVLNQIVSITEQFLELFNYMQINE